MEFEDEHDEEQEEEDDDEEEITIPPPPQTPLWRGFPATYSPKHPNFSFLKT